MDGFRDGVAAAVTAYALRRDCSVKLDHPEFLGTWFEEARAGSGQPRPSLPESRT